MHGVRQLMLFLAFFFLLLAGIWTAAMAMLGGGEAIKEQCRSVDIMSDAAYAILTRDSKTFTGNFAVDDEVLKQEGCTDFEKYSCVPGEYFFVCILSLMLHLKHCEMKLCGTTNKRFSFKWSQLYTN